MLKKIVKFFFSGEFNLIASVASVVGFLLVIFTDKNAIIIALSCFVAFLLLLLFKVYSVLKTFILQTTENGYHRFATYVRYSTEDGKHIVYELHKYLQCKTVIMDEHIHHFFWTGSTDPNISSSLQEFKEFVRTPKGEYDYAILKFRKPITYNDFAIVHIKMDLDDSDDKAKPFCEQSVNEELQLVNFRVELRHLENNSDAKVSRRKLNTALFQEYEPLGFVLFDKQSKSYEYSIFNPEVGYAYKIEWEKNPSNNCVKSKAPRKNARMSSQP